MRYFPDTAMALLGAVAGVTLLLAFWAGRRVHDAADFLTAGWRANRWWVALSLLCALLGGLLLMAVTAAFTEQGMGALRVLVAGWLWLPFMLWVWTPIVQRNRLITVPEYLGRRFDPALQRATAGLLVLLLLGLAGLELAAFGATLRVLTGQPALFWAGLLAAVVTLYAVWGGQLAVMLTNGLHGVALLLGLGVLGIAASGLAGPGELWAGAPRSLRSLVPEAGQGQGAAGMAVLVDLGPVLLAAWLANQAFMGRLVAARGERSAGSGALIALGPASLVLLAALAAAGFAALLLGDLGRVPADQPAHMVLGSLIASLGGPLTLSLLAALLLAAALSTLDALLVGVGALVAVDLRADRRAAPRLGRARIGIAAAGGAALGLAVLADVLDGLLSLGGQATLLLLVLGAPVALLVTGGALLRRLDGRAAWITLALGLVGALSTYGLSSVFSSGDGALDAATSLQRAGLGALGGAGLGLILGAALGRRPGSASLAGLTRGELGPAWAPVTVIVPLSCGFTGEPPAEPSAADGADSAEDPAGVAPADGTDAADAADAADTADPIVAATATAAAAFALPPVRLPARARQELSVQPGAEVHVRPVRRALLGWRSFRARVAEGSSGGQGLEVSAEVAAREGLADGQDVVIERVA
jgi:SSS family solute:Na+ symporter